MSCIGRPEALFCVQPLSASDGLYFFRRGIRAAPQFYTGIKLELSVCTCTYERLERRCMIFCMPAWFGVS